MGKGRRAIGRAWGWRQRLERGDVATTWKTERWDSLRLLTPNWQSRLPGLAYDGDDPDGFMTMPEVVDFISGFAVAAGSFTRS